AQSNCREESCSRQAGTAVCAPSGCCCCRTGFFADGSYCFLVAGGTAGGFAPSGGVAGGFAPGGGVAAGLDADGAAAPAGCASSYSFTISLVISIEGSPHSTGVCGLLMSITIAKPFLVAYLMMMSIIFWPRSFMILPSSCWTSAS